MLGGNDPVTKTVESVQVPEESLLWETPDSYVSFYR